MFHVYQFHCQLGKSPGNARHRHPYTEHQKWHHRTSQTSTSLGRPPSFVAGIKGSISTQKLLGEVGGV